MTINIGLDINNGYNLSIVPMHNYMGHIKNNGASRKYYIGTILFFPCTLTLMQICGVCAEPRTLIVKPAVICLSFLPDHTVLGATYQDTPDF